MENICNAVLLEVVSIQSYIFQSNKLKTNLGASHLIQREVLGEYLKKAVNEVFHGNTDPRWFAWRGKPEETLVATNGFDVGYIGGGNALLLFMDEEDAKQVVRRWSRNLLVETPGIQTSVAFGKLRLKDGFREDMKKLFRTLRDNKARFIPQASLSRHGITAECPQSGLSAEVFDTDSKQYLSASVAAKLKASLSGKDYFANLFQNQLESQFVFPENFEKLGRVKGKDSHIAIVHIDGNRMAKRFRETVSLTELRTLSDSVERITREAFTAVVQDGVSHYADIMESLGFARPGKTDSALPQPPKQDGRYILPLAPLVIGGDDVTFVSDGKLGIYFSERFISAFEARSQKMLGGRPLTACAGVAITHTKFPFYRGYQLADELCGNAKKRMAEKAMSPDRYFSALDFQIVFGGVSSTLKQIREEQYRNTETDLLWRPYRVGRTDDPGEHGLDEVLKLTAQVKKDFPDNKIKELRQVLTQPKADRSRFVMDMKKRGRSLPDIKGKNFSESLVENKETPYFDMIELLQFYPRYALTGKEDA